MKLPKILLSLVVASFLTSGLAFAADASAGSSTAPKKAGCCEKASKNGKTCEHECCAEAAKDGKNCPKCGGEGKLETKK
jgi:hypothetical protein